ncbi:ABC transporter substrate-binding protein [Streptacidiphilus carbonis]|uniref:ABC transporter substrate-binding protein n=1 Tax=Streptacidiphilus carbonis TaxID=105422 RepID=UPI0005A65747|nr:ABC transporter substrate-binding protein [Streptacidiphilus carbonis]
MSRNTTIKGLALVAVVGLGLTACTSSGATGNGGSSSSASGSTGSSTKTLVIEDKPVPSFDEDFNPFDGNAFGANENAISLTYEPLFMFNSLKSDQPPIPWLGKSYAWSNGNKTLTINLQSGVKWSDGQAFSSADVKFTFELLQKTAAANTGGVPATTSMTTPDSNTLVMNFSTPQASNFVAIGNQVIVPQHLWSSVSNPATAQITSAQAIGTGPYLVDKFSSQNVTYKANPSYWGGAPAVKEISFPAYATNDAATLALASGQIDLAGNDINNVQSVFVAKDPAHNHLFQSSAPYFPAANTVSLLLNQKSTTAPALADVAVRKAISAAVDRQSLASQCETNYELPATSSGGLIASDVDKALVSSATANTLKPNADTSTVSSLLTADGYAKVGGKWTKNGKTIKFTIIDPNSFSDYWCDAQAMVKGLNAQGFDINDNGAFTYDTWNAAITTGKYDAALHWGQGVTAFQRLQFILDPSTTADVGKTAAGDFGRYTSSKATAAIQAYQNATTPDAQKTALDTLQQIFNDDVPAVPVLYGAAWYEYSSANFTGWPTSDNPFINPSPNSQAYEYLVLKLKPVS